MAIGPSRCWPWQCPAPASTVPLLQDRGLLDGQAAAYVCRNLACQAPVTEPEALWAQLEQR